MQLLNDIADSGVFITTVPATEVQCLSED